MRADPNKIRVVLDEVAKAYGLTVAQLRGHDRHPRLAWPRQIAMTLAVDLVPARQTEVAAIMAHENSTVYWARKQVRNATECYPKVRVEVERVKSGVQARLTQCNGHERSVA